MTRVIPVQFPVGEVLDRVGVVWVTMPRRTGLLNSRIVGTCSVDPLELSLAQVTVERGGWSWSLDLLRPDHPASFPLDRGFALVVPGFNLIDQIAWGLDAAMTRIIVHVRRSSPDRATFQLTLLADASEVEEPSWDR